MICETAPKVDIRHFGQAPPQLCTRWGWPIQVVATPCHYGGQRYWLLCPTCGRRCAILYSRHVHPEGCRLCIKGRYLLERESPAERRLTTAFRIRCKLGQTEGGIVVPFPPKPRLMRWHTYLRLREQGEAIKRQLWDDATKRLERKSRSSWLRSGSGP